MRGDRDSSFRSPPPAEKLPPNSEALAHSLFSTYLLPFEIASVLLLVAMVGAVVMAKKGSEPAMMPIGHYLFLSLALFIIGTIGVITRRNVIIVLMSIELILNAVNINLVAFSRVFGDVAGQVFALFIIADAAAEAAIGLGIIIAFLPQPRNSSSR